MRRIGRKLGSSQFENQSFNFDLDVSPISIKLRSFSLHSASATKNLVEKVSKEARPVDCIVDQVDGESERVGLANAKEIDESV